MTRPRASARNLVSLLALGGLLAAVSSCGSNSQPNNNQAPPPPGVPLTKLSTDTFTNTSSQHATEVEPGAFAFGSTIVTAFQVGRIFAGGAADIGFATSTNGGATWTNDFLPGLTIFQGGSATAASDPAVAFDSTHGVWLISSLLLGTTTDVVVSRSTDGITWDLPITVSATPDADKNWVACDNSPSSPFLGNCYMLWDDPTHQDLIWMGTSVDGGLTWATARNTANQATGIGGVPVVLPNGTVVVPFTDVFLTHMLAFKSADGGATWSAPVTISNITDHLVAGNLRTDPLPTVAVDAAGKIYVAWQDCRFRPNCPTNDIVLSTSTDGNTWTTAVRIPIDSPASTVDHFIPALAADPATSGTTAHLALTYYFYPNTSCTQTTCALTVGFVSSANAGSTWSAPTTLTSPMLLTWLPSTSIGLMVGDYVSTVYSGGQAFPIFALAKAKAGSLFDEAIYTTATGLREGRGAVFTSAGETAVPNPRSDHPPRKFYDLEGRHPIPR